MATVSMSMAAKLSDLDDQKTGANIHTEGHTLTPGSGWHGPEEMPPIHHPSPWQGNQHMITTGTQYCLDIHVISTEDGGTTPPPPHASQAPVVEDMVWDGNSDRSSSD